MVASAAITLIGLFIQRQAQIDITIRRRLEHASADMRSVLDEVRAVLVAIAPVADLRECPEQLHQLREASPGYVFFAILDRDGRIACASDSAIAAELGSRPPWLAQLLNVGELEVGALVTLGGPGSSVLPVIVPDSGTGGHDRLVLALVDLKWLGFRLGGVEAIGSGDTDGAKAAILDDRGTILVGSPEGREAAGQQAPADIRRLLDAPSPGTATVRGADGLERLTAYDWVRTGPTGLFLIEEIYPPDLMGDLTTAITLALLLGALALAVAISTTVVTGRRFIERPTGRLLAAAQRWREGDLAARAELPGDASEFGDLANAFNAMAGGLQLREAEQARQSQLLESRVAERTRELSESNNRLQVEMAEHRRTEVVLQQAQKLQAVGRLAGGLAHDFNNLLATILGNLELIERRVPAEDGRLARMIERAIDAVQRGSKLTSRLLAFSRRQRLTARPTDINHLVTDLVTLASSTLGPGVRIETALSPGLWHAHIDPSQVEAAILNLAFNARDAMPQGGTMTIATANRSLPDSEASLEPGDYVEITVSDTGIGMPPEIAARAFEPFFTTKEIGRNSGLGLSQVYGVARQSGGSVSIASEVGRGTTVTLLLPRTSGEWTEGSLTPAATDARSGSGLVLLVDDDADVRQVSVEMLTELGYEVAQAASGSEALQIVPRLPSPPALLVLDYAMPGMNGLHLAAALRRSGLQAPFLLATGYAELSDEVSGVTPDAILHKPFTLNELDRTLRRLSEPPTSEAA